MAYIRIAGKLDPENPTFRKIEEELSSSIAHELWSESQKKYPNSLILSKFQLFDEDLFHSSSDYAALGYKKEHIPYICAMMVGSGFRYESVACGVRNFMLKLDLVYISTG
jgi:hypothetical protein